MKYIQLFILITITCYIEEKIEDLRPGASYILHSGDYQGLEWLDKKQPKPTEKEIENILQGCQERIFTPINMQDKLDNLTNLLQEKGIITNEETTTINSNSIAQ